MPEGQRASAIQRIVASLTRGRVAGGVAFVGAMTIFAVAISSAGAAGAGRTDQLRADAAAADDASHSVLIAPKLTPAEATALADIEHFAKIAAQPTATAVPPTAVPPTPVPPTATAVRPATTAVAPSATPVVRIAVPPTEPPPPPPTSTPIPPPAAPPPTAPPPQSGLDTSPMDSYSQALFDATNRRRAGAGLPPLRPNGQLVGIARIRSQDMADNDYFAHVSPTTGDNAFSLMDKYGVPYGWAGENLAKNNYATGQTVGVADEALWNSPPHKENILNPNYTDMGIALVIDGDGMKYFTIIFTGPA